MRRLKYVCFIILCLSYFVHVSFALKDIVFILIPILFSFSFILVPLVSAWCWTLPSWDAALLSWIYWRIGNDTCAVLYFTGVLIDYLFLAFSLIFGFVVASLTLIFFSIFLYYFLILFCDVSGLLAYFRGIIFVSLHSYFVFDILRPHRVFRGVSLEALLRFLTDFVFIKRFYR